MWSLLLPTNTAIRSTCWRETLGGDPHFGHAIHSWSNTHWISYFLRQTAAKLLFTTWDVFPLFINSALGELISGTLEISLLGIQARNIFTAQQGALQSGTVEEMVQLVKQCSLYVGVSVKLREAIKPLHWKVVVIFHQNIFKLKKMALIFWKKLCDELLLWLNFSLFLLLENQNNFTFISRKKKQRDWKDVDKRKIVIFALFGFRNRFLHFHWFSKDTSKK